MRVCSTHAGQRAHAQRASTRARKRCRRACRHLCMCVWLCALHAAIGSLSFCAPEQSKRCSMSSWGASSWQAQSTWQGDGAWQKDWQSDQPGGASQPAFGSFGSLGSQPAGPKTLPPALLNMVRNRETIQLTEHTAKFVYFQVLMGDDNMKWWIDCSENMSQEALKASRGRGVCGFGCKGSTASTCFSSYQHRANWKTGVAGCAITAANARRCRTARRSFSSGIGTSRDTVPGARPTRSIWRR